LGNGDNAYVGSAESENFSFGDGLNIAAMGDGDDTITGGDEGNAFDGGAGNDNIRTGDGDDTLIGGEGDDDLRAGTGTDSISGGAGDDYVEVQDGLGDTISGGAGRDTLVIRHDLNTFNTGNESFTFDPLSADTVTFSDGTQFDGFEDLRYYGRVGNDRVEVIVDRMDHLVGDVRGGAGGGIDTLRIDLSALTDGVTINTSQVVGADNAVPLYFSGFELAEFVGTSGHDTIALTANTAFAANDAFADGGAGNDSIRTGDGDDTLIGGDGDDDLRAGTGTDSISGGAGDDYVYGENGNDTLDGGVGDDFVTGGDGSDLITSSVGIDFISGDQGNDTVVLTGTTNHTSGYVAFNVSSDTQVGTQARINLEGLVRIEAVTDGGGDADIVQLSEEGDAFFLHDAYSGFHSSVSLTEDYVGNESAARFANIEEIRGMGGNDIIDLTSSDYSLAGVSMTIDGGEGNDFIWGSDANENISGGDGDDTIFGGIGADVLSGDLGADVFEFTRTSTNTSVTDFDVGEGDMLRFYNAGGAEFDASSVALTANGITIFYTDTASGIDHDISIALAASAAEFSATLPEILNVLEFI
jgi:Ca2+-binding RTX toxin-like protein